MTHDLERLLTADVPARAAHHMAAALREYLGHVLGDDPGDCDPRLLPLFIKAYRQARALQNTLGRIAR